jgi:hypothetical protein
MVSVFLTCRVFNSFYICAPENEIGTRLTATQLETGNTNAKVAQLVEHDLAKVGVASSNLVFRSKALL